MRSTLLLIFFITATVSLGQGLKAKGKVLVDKHGKEVLLRGIGLGGWMLQEPYMLQLSGIAMAQHEIRSKIKELAGDETTEKFYAAWLRNHCTKADIDSLAAWGFNSVRLPMHFNLFTLPAEQEPVKGKHTWVKKGFELTDSLLNWCKANQIYLILDLHAAPGGQGNDNAISDRDTLQPSLWQSGFNQEKTIALWQKLAEHYANEEWLGAYDLLNEPNWGFRDAADKNGCAEELNQPLVDLLKKITQAIRKVDKKHLIIIEGNCWGNNYNGMLPLFDDNMAVSFHKYWNYTDQGSIQKFIDYRDRYHVPVWMGESGENSNSWFTDAIQLLEKNKIGWAWWPLKKMGINNPLQVKTNADYQKIISYWQGKGQKPSAGETEQGLMQLAADTRVSNNIVRKDVVDAMHRQVTSTATLPYNKIIMSPGVILFASDYDMGKLNHAYFDVDSGNYWVSTSKRTDWNKGWQYRNDGVDIQQCTDSITNGYNVGWIEDGEWLQFTVFSPDDAVYTASLRYSAKTSEGKVQLTANGVSAEMITLPPTGDHHSWKTSAACSVSLSKGWNRVRIFMQKGGFNLNYLELASKQLTSNINRSR
jgi:endoglucanase